MRKIDIIVIGGVTWDYNIVKGRRWSGFGGGVTYSTYILGKLGVNVGVVSYISQELYDRYINRLKMDNIDFSGLKVRDKAIIRFINEYHNDRRIQKASPSNYKIFINDIPREYFKAKYAIITPVIGEVSSRIPIYLKRRGIRVLVDLQGFTREIRNDNVTYKSIKWLPLNFIDLIKGNIDEVRDILWKVEKLKYKLKYAVVTLGRKGSYIYDLYNKIKLYFPTIRVKSIDSTGAGDVYLALLAFTLYRGGDIEKAGILATAYAAYSSQFKGPIYPINNRVIDKLINKVRYIKEDANRPLKITK